MNFNKNLLAPPALWAAVLFLALLAGEAWGAPSRAGLVSFRRLPVPDESPAHLSTALAEDRQGFLWIGTQSGLVRFDGSRFKVFRSDPGDPATLGGSYVRSLLAASDDRLWVGTFSGGLAVYDPARESFVRYRHVPGEPGSLSHNRVEAIAEDRSGRIWIATDEGLDRLDPLSGQIDHFLAANRLRALLVDRGGQLWVGGRDGVQVWRGEGRGFERMASGSVVRLAEDDRGRIWIGTMDTGAAVLDPRTGRLRRLAPRPADPQGLSHFWISGFAQVTPREIWLATFGGGIDVVDAESLAVIDRLHHDPALASTPGGDRIGALLRDRSGVVWAGTWGQGLARHDPATRAFRRLEHSPNRPDGLSHPAVVRALETRDGTIWVGTNGNGIDLFDRELRLAGSHRPDPGNPGALSDGSITCLAEGPDGSVWVASLNGVLHRLRPGARQFERISVAQGLPGGAIRALTFGPQGELWIGAADGLARLDPATSKIVSFRHKADDPSTLSGSAVEAIALGPDGTLWVGTDSGLNAFDPAKGVAVRILSEPGRRDSLPDNWVPDLMVAADGRLWVATQGGACILESWDGRNARFLRVAEKMGRPAGPVEALIQDAEGQVWLGPRLRVDPRTWRFRELGPADGCDFRSFFIASRSRTRGGDLLFGSPEGLLVVSPGRIVPWAYAPPVVATGLYVDGVERPGAARLENLSLQPDEKGFRLDFAALDFTAPQKVAYRYRLEGYDASWIPADAARSSLAYNNLAPGEYTLRVEGTNRAGRWSEWRLTLPVTILPAFHQTLASRLAIVAGFLALSYGLYRLRVRQLQARSRKLEQLVRERTMALEEAYAKIEEASLTDPLTGLRNRRFLEQSIEADLALSNRRHQEGDSGEADLVFLLLDLDHFKSVNDTYGHAAGDAVLVQAASVLRGVMRSSDHVVRWGGEEFLAVARFVSRENGPELAEKIRAALAAHPFQLPDGTVLRRTGSIGFAAYPFLPSEPHAIRWEEVVDLADSGLYAAKRGGRDRWVGVAAGDAEDPREALGRFRENPEAAVGEGEVRLVVG